MKIIFAMPLGCFDQVIKVLNNDIHLKGFIKIIKNAKPQWPQGTIFSLEKSEKAREICS